MLKGLLVCLSRSLVFTERRVILADARVHYVGQRVLLLQVSLIVLDSRCVFTQTGECFRQVEMGCTDAMVGRVLFDELAQQLARGSVIAVQKGAHPELI